jgi:predicted outer membrane repeat protein
MRFSFRQWLQGLAKSNRGRRRQPGRLRLQVEALEERWVLNAYTVNILGDTSGVISGNGGGLFGDLRFCVFAASQDGQVDTISFASNVAGTTIALGSPGQLELGASGSGTGTITIDGGGQVTVSGSNASRIFLVDPGETATLKGLTLSAGTVSGDSGGAIANNGTLTVTNCVLSGNAVTASASGGAIYNGNSATLTVNHSSFSGDTAGGGSTDASGNSGSGGAIYNSSGGMLTVTDSQFTSNTAGSNAAGGSGAGAIFNGGTLMVTGSTFSDNSGGYVGGAITNSGTATVDQSTFSGGTTQAGGGIFNAGSLQVTNSTFFDNTASYTGGGVGNGSGNTATLTNDTFSTNTAGYGGAVGNAGNCTLTYVTIAGNTATNDGGGIYSSATLTLYNTLVAGNTASTANLDVDADNGGGAHSGSIASISSNNLIGVDSTDVVGISNGTNGNQIGVANPGLANGLHNNGGPTLTIALQPGSPAIGAGVAIAGISTDQRGLLRPPTPSIGAFEANPVIPAVVVAIPGVPANPGALQAFLFQGPQSPRNTALDFIITDPTPQAHALYVFWGNSRQPQIIPLGVGAGTFFFQATHRYSIKSFRQHRHKPYTVLACVLSGPAGAQTLLGGEVLVLQYSPREVLSFGNG